MMPDWHCQSGQPRVKLLKYGLKMWKKGCQEKFEKPVRPLEASLLLGSSRPLTFPAAQQRGSPRHSREAQHASLPNLPHAALHTHPLYSDSLFYHINFVQKDLVEFTLNIGSSASDGMRGGGIAQPCVKWALSKISIQGRSYLEVST